VAGAIVVAGAAAGAWYVLHAKSAGGTQSETASAAPQRTAVAAPAVAAPEQPAAADTGAAPAAAVEGPSLDRLALDLMDKEKKLQDARDQLAAQQHAQAAAPAVGKPRTAASAAPAEGEPAAEASTASDQEAAKLKQLQEEVDRLRKEKEVQQAAVAAAASAAPARSQASASGPDYQTWYRQAMANVRQNLAYPKSSLQDGEEGELTVKVHMRRDGTILGTQVQQRSSYAALNREATDVFTRIGRLQPVPPDYSPGNNEFDVSMPITFKMGE
jgi:TonB family protein